MSKRKEAPHALSNLDVMRVTGCQFILYSQMKDVQNINELINPYTLILYQLAKIGHFCCVFRDRFGTLNFFDPIGTKIDDELKHVQRGYKAPYHNFTYLTRLFYRSGEDVEYNNYQYQIPTSTVCGYWCALRMKYSFLTCDEFYRKFKKLAHNDNGVVKKFIRVFYMQKT